MSAVKFSSYIGGHILASPNFYKVNSVVSWQFTSQKNHLWLYNIQSNLVAINTKIAPTMVRMEGLTSISFPSINSTYKVHIHTDDASGYELVLYSEF